MRRVAKLSLLLAPLVLAGMSGCAVQSRWMSRDVQVAPPTANRAQCMMYVAEQLERSGKEQLAREIYEHLLAQEPGHAVALERLKRLETRPGESQSEMAAVSTTRTDLPATEAPSPASRHEWAHADLSADTSFHGVTTAHSASDNSESTASSEQLPLVRPAVRGRSRPTPRTVSSDHPLLPKIAGQGAAAESGSQEAATPAPSNDWWATVFQPSIAPGPEPEANPEDEASSADSFAATADFQSPLEPMFDSEAEELTELDEMESVNAAWELVSVVDGDVSRSGADAHDVPTSKASSNDVTDVNVQWSRTSLVRLCEELDPHLLELVKKLESASANDRCDALYTLGQMGSPAEPTSLAIRALLDDADARVRSHAAGALRNIHGDAWDTVRVLSSLLKDQDVETVRFTAYLLGQMGPEATHAVDDLQALRDTSTGLTKLHAAEALARITPEDAVSVQVLAQGLSEDDAHLRWFSAMSLGSVSAGQQDQAVSALKNALHDTDANVRATAALSLGGFGEHAQPAIDDLQRAIQFDTPEVRDAASAALACIKVTKPAQ